MRLSFSRERAPGDLDSTSLGAGFSESLKNSIPQEEIESRLCFGSLYRSLTTGLMADGAQEALSPGARPGMPLFTVPASSISPVGAPLYLAQVLQDPVLTCARWEAKIDT